MQKEASVMCGKGNPWLMANYIQVGELKSVTCEPLVFFSSKAICKPFLKWAGGKTQLIPELSKYVPASFNKYIEPFIGGGAFFFHLNPSKAIIADLNEELIITYKAVQQHVEEVISTLRTFKNKESFYYQLRATSVNTLTFVERAARLVYLNKTCFNGLYRVNKKGQFNVPYGKEDRNFLNETSLRAVSEFLKETTILYADYKSTLLKHAQEGDFLFLDPPYYPLGKHSSFKQYIKEPFYHEDHILLKQEFDKLVAKGCYVLLTNSAHPFILELYKEYRIEIIETKRIISSNPNTRNGKDIIVIGGYH